MLKNFKEIYNKELTRICESGSRLEKLILNCSFVRGFVYEICKAVSQQVDTANGYYISCGCVGPKGPNPDCWVCGGNGIFYCNGRNYRRWENIMKKCENCRRYENESIMYMMLLDAIHKIINGQEVTDFELSFSSVREVYDKISQQAELHKE